MRRHIFDSLCIAPYVTGEQILDVGSGAGIPGIPLAIALPDRQFSLLDSNGKKTRFLTQAKIELRLNNLDVINTRVEQFHPPRLFDTIITRAFADVATTLNLLDHLWSAAGQLLLMKGPGVYDEFQSLPAGYRSEVLPLSVPDTPQKRYLLIVKRSDDHG